MDRWTKHQVATSFDKYSGLDSWNEESHLAPVNTNILANLCENLNKYEVAYRQQQSKAHYKSNRRRSVECKYRVKTFIAQSCCSLKRIQEEKKKHINKDTENPNPNKKKISYSPRIKSQMELSVKQLQFDLLARPNPKKRDRYREIFGQKPKHVMRKVTPLNSTNIR